MHAVPGKVSVAYLWHRAIVIVPLPIEALNHAFSSSDPTQNPAATWRLMGLSTYNWASAPNYEWANPNMRTVRETGQHFRELVKSCAFTWSNFYLVAT